VEGGGWSKGGVKSEVMFFFGGALVVKCDFIPGV